MIRRLVVAGDVAEQFGPYVLGPLLGVGGMGEVYRAHDTRRDRAVALKLLPEAISVDEEYLARFRREQQIAARLNDPHIVPIHDFGEIDGRLYLDMRLVEGRDVGRILSEDGPLPVARVVHLVSQVADALDAAHADKLVHRDIKPSNILVTPKDFAYVTDFGIARFLGTARVPVTMTGATVGTLAYMAPERFTQGPVDGRADVYALACVLHECLTGAPPFAGDDLPAFLYAHLQAEPPRAGELVEGVPAALDDVIRRGMAKDPDDRPPTAGALAAAAVAALLPTPAPAPATVVGAAPVTVVGGPVAPAEPVPAMAAAAAPAGLLPSGPMPLVEAAPSGPMPLVEPAPSGALPLVEAAPSGALPLIEAAPSGALPVVEPPPPVAVPLPRQGSADRPDAPAAVRPVIASTGAALPAVLVPVPTSVPSRSGGRLRFRALLFTLVVSALVAAGIVGGVVKADGAVAAATEPPGTPGDDPFMPAPGQDGVGQPLVRNLSATVAGDAPGLYGGTRTESCNSAQIAGFLAAHPEQATAWAGVQGIAPDGIDGFLATLTPVTLRSDTAVTNHGFKNGAATELRSVLQAGTGVLVDPNGLPRVRCYCGNPLGPPAPDTHYADPVTRIQPAARPVTDFVVVQSGTNAVVVRPTGSSGEKDRPADPAEKEKARALVGDSFHQDSDGVDGKGAAGGSDGTGSAAGAVPGGATGAPASTADPSAGVADPQPPAVAPAPTGVADDPPGAPTAVVVDPPRDEAADDPPAHTADTGGADPVAPAHVEAPVERESDPEPDVVTRPSAELRERDLPAVGTALR